MPHRLSALPERPLTSREITKVLTSIIGGVVVSEPSVHAIIPELLEHARGDTGEIFVGDREIERKRHRLHQIPSWEIAFMATISGLRGWCSPSDVDTALAWIEENLPRIYTGLGVRLPS